jgi:hypothetical protein
MNRQVWSLEKGTFLLCRTPVERIPRTSASTFLTRSLANTRREFYPDVQGQLSNPLTLYLDKHHQVQEDITILVVHMLVFLLNMFVLEH